MAAAPVVVGYTQEFLRCGARHRDGNDPHGGPVAHADYARRILWRRRVAHEFETSRVRE